MVAAERGARHIYGRLGGKGKELEVRNQRMGL